jgi:biofilm protein TabA
MIVGLLSDVSKQKSVLPGPVVRAIEAMLKLDLPKMDAGRYELEGDQLYYMIQDVETRSLEESRSEAHQRYADIQIPLDGAERYGYALPQAGLVASEERLETNDIAFYPAPANEAFIDIEPGSFVVFLPGELHRPCLAIKQKGKLRKVVVKVHGKLLGL